MRKPTEPTPTVSLAFAAREFFKVTPDTLRGMKDRREVAAERFSPERWAFDRGDVEQWNPAAIGKIDAIAAKFISEQRAGRTRSATSPAAVAARVRRRN